MRHVGFSGTQKGMTSSQIWSVDKLLDDDLITQVAHHGDCVGADADFHNLSVMQGLKIVGHLPIKDAQRAFCVFNETRVPKDYIDRNHDIVDESDWMIFTPFGFEEILRSGTWATIRYTRIQQKPGFIVWPDGSVVDVLQEV